ncbi:hypothetical protein AFEL58S_02039 [Afipia felis]
MIFSGIAALIGGIASSVGAFIGGFGAIGTFALQTAAGIGVSYLAKALAGKPKQQATSNGVSGVQGQLQAAGDVPRQFMLGKGATAGSLVYANAWGNDGQTPNAYFTQVIALSDLPVKGLLGLWVNGEKCTLGGAVHPDFGYPVTQYAKGGKDHLWIKFYDGTQTAVDGFLASRVSTLDRPYASNRVGIGIAYAICTALVEDTLFTGFPQFLFELDGVRLYDPSKDSTNGGDGEQRYSDPATWGGDGDDLPAVQIYNLFCGLKYGDEWFYGFQNFSGRRAVPENWTAQIAKCRAPIDGASGPEPTYRSAGQVSVDTALGDTVEALLTSCQGKVSEIGGFYKLYCGVPDSPAFFFTDDDILSTEEQSFTPFFGLADTVNGISGKYPAPSEGWAMKPAPPIYRTDLEAKAGNRRLLSDVSLDFVPYAEQVQRLMNSALLAAQRARRHAFSFGPKFWFVEPGDVGAWTSARNGYVNKLFEANGVVDKANLDVTLDLTEVDPSDYDWDHDADFKPPTSGPTAIIRPAPQGVLDWFVEGIVLRDAAGISRRPAIRMTWDGAMPGVSGVQYEVRLKSDGSDVTRGRTDQLAAGALIVSQSLLPNAQYQVRGQYLPDYPRDMVWTDWLDVTTPDVRLGLFDIAEYLSEQFTEVEKRAADDRARVDKLAQVVQQAMGRTNLDKRILRTDLVSASDRANASISQVMTVATDAESAVAALETTVSAQFDDINAAVSENSTAITTLNGYAAAQWSVMVDVNGNIVGVVLFNDSDNISNFTVTVDTFRVAFPGQSGGDAVPVYTISNVGGVAKVALRGDMIVDGSLITRMIAAGAITTTTIQAGAVNTTQLAVNSVDITKLIQGAATKFDYTPTPAVKGYSFPSSGNQTLPYTLATRVVDIQSGAAKIEFTGRFNGFQAQAIGAFTSQDFIRFYVDGTLEFEFMWQTPGYLNGAQWVAYNWQNIYAMWPKLGLSAGSHTFSVVLATSYGCGVTNGAFLISDFRR